jgi:hypothetical protein
MIGLSDDSSTARRFLCFSVFILWLLLAIGCGGQVSPSGPSSQYVELGKNASGQEVEKLLKFDSRVRDFEIDGDRLIVNVNQYWMGSPPGMQQQALGQWLSSWQAERSEDGKVPKGLEVVVRFEDKDVARATPERGIEFITQAKGEGGQPK